MLTIKNQLFSQPAIEDKDTGAAIANRMRSHPKNFMESQVDHLEQLQKEAQSDDEGAQNKGQAEEGSEEASSYYDSEEEGEEEEEETADDKAMRLA